jgi:hypothetical protein
MTTTTTNSQAVATENARPGNVAPLATAVTKSDIARCRYDFFLARGSEDGHNVDDWLQAERELTAHAE